MWILVVIAYAGALSSGDSVALTNVGPFQTEKQCVVAGEKVKQLEKGSIKVVRYSCVQTKD